MSNEVNLEILGRLMKKAIKEIPSSPLLKLPRSGGRNGFYVPTKTVQAKRHKRKSSRRWQKKWLKKFGTVEVPRWNVSFASDHARDFSVKTIGVSESPFFNTIVYQRRATAQNIPDPPDINETTLNAVKKLIEKDIENYNLKRLSEMWIYHKTNDL